MHSVCTHVTFLTIFPSHIRHSLTVSNVVSVVCSIVESCVVLQHTADIHSQLAMWSVLYVLLLFSSTQMTFTHCEKSSNNQNNCTVEDPFSVAGDGVLIIKVNGSNAVSSTSTAEQRVQLHDIGECVARRHSDIAVFL